MHSTQKNGHRTRLSADVSVGHKIHASYFMMVDRGSYIMFIKLLHQEEDADANERLTRITLTTDCLKSMLNKKNCGNIVPEHAQVYRFGLK